MIGFRRDHLGDVMTARMPSALAMVLAVYLGFGASARADNQQLAREAFQEGSRYYDTQDFKNALEAFKKAYQNYDDPSLLFNIAQCYRRLGQNSEAVRFYQSYLQKVPDAPDRAAVSDTIVALQQAGPAEPAPARSAEETPTALAAPQAPIAVPVQPPVVARAAARPVPVYKKWWLWTTVAVVAAGTATAIGVGITQSRSSEGTVPPVHVP
jgi:tetratricopeptide (TPR) repeat protein